MGTFREFDKYCPNAANTQRNCIYFANEQSWSVELIANCTRPLITIYARFDTEPRKHLHKTIRKWNQKLVTNRTRFSWEQKPYDDQPSKRTKSNETLEMEMESSTLQHALELVIQQQLNWIWSGNKFVRLTQSSTSYWIVLQSDRHRSRSIFHEWKQRTCAGESESENVRLLLHAVPFASPHLRIEMLTT